MISFCGISASIQMGGQDLEHFQPEFDEETKTVTCWIPSEAGKCYSIWWQQDIDTSPGAFIAGRVYLDGSEEMKAGVITGFYGCHSIEHDAVFISSMQQWPFMFANINLTDDATTVTTSNIPSDLSSIKLTIHHVRKGGVIPFTGYGDDGRSVMTLHECSKKAGGHITK
ncbi:hypothetical protein FRB94_001598 [Tulasnella sp. JGI-2019a]|nr:hypothetical protein FRB94_001598 [Tulasnella sp. JGI-2019a]